MKKLCLLAILVVSLRPLSGQNEQVVIESSEEEMDTVKFSKLLKTYNDVIRVHEEELNIFKIDLLGPVLYGLSNWGPENDTVKNNVLRIAYEQKFRPDWSWTLGSDVQADRKKVRDVRLNAGVRYYYNLNHRILKNKSANNFSANYISVSSSGRTRPGEDDYHLSLNLLYGIQRRIGKMGFVDFDVGLEGVVKAYSDRETGIDFTSRIVLGLAF